MDRIAQTEFKDMELDPELLATPFKVQTNWHVITGASSSGKTTLIDQLAERGQLTFPEVGRQYFERELSKGRTVAEIREDRAAMTREIYNLWLEFNKELRASEITFLDRGLPDALSFYRFAGMNPNEILSDCFQHRYASVFILNRLPYQQDGIRSGDDISAAYFDMWMERDYSALGYDIVRVPVLPPEERLAFILDKLPITDRADEV
jgi:predicted ATPase